MPSDGFQCQVRGGPENQGSLTRGFPEEAKVEPRPSKEDEKKKGSVFHVEAAECAEEQARKQPCGQGLKEVQCGWVTAWADLKRAKTRSRHRQPACYLKEFELHGKSMGSYRNGLEKVQMIKLLISGKQIEEAKNVGTKIIWWKVTALDKDRSSGDGETQRKPSAL